VSKFTLGLALVVMLSAFTVSCGGDTGALEDGMVAGNVQAEPRELSSEMVTIDEKALTCAVENELFSAPEQGGGRTIARLTEKGRTLFSDDVSIGEAGFKHPYSQVRGKLPLQVPRVVKISNGSDNDTKIVEAMVSVVISHPCFPQPLPMLGVRKGRLSEDTPVTMEFDRVGSDWHFEKIIH
jgi:hypothetical protein